ncbi:MAG TPA: SRPBCC domain-containing protein [Thermoleophilaceae bacterium]|nr:SRPBCC domain-containing protein [Thermoleophilaceae bacterium]
MEHTVERELLVPETADEVWSSLARPDWLGEDAEIELRPAGSVRAGERSGFVEEAEEPRRLCFWWSEEGGEASRVELELTIREEGTLLRVVESRPLAVLDAYGHDLAGALRPAGPQMSAAPCLVA